MKSKKLVILAMIVIMLIAMQVSVFASNGTVVVTGNNGTSDSGTVQIPTLNQSTTTGTTGTTTIPSVQSTTITTPTPTPTPTSTQNSTYTKTNLPKTGIDYTALLVIVVCVISGVYAFIKIRDYNQIKY